MITAAHCQSQNDPIAQVVLGQDDLDKDPQCNTCAPAQRFDIKFNDVTVHENWNIRKIVKESNDVALIRLPRLVDTYMEDTSFKIMPICIGLYN